jgi:sulfonate transport system permease protein
MRKIKKISVGMTLPVIILLIWYLVTGEDTFLSSPGTVFKTTMDSLRTGFLTINLWISFRRVTQGFLIGISFGFLIGSVMGLSSIAEKIIAPFFHAIRNIPVIGWMPLLIIWFGFGDMSEVMFLSIGAFYPVVLNTFQGIRGVKLQYIEVGQVFGYSHFKLFFKIILPAALPSIFTGIRVSLGVSWMLVVAAEMFGVTNGGIGNMMNDAREFFRMDIVVMGIIAIGIVGFLLNHLLSVIEGKFLSWHDTSVNVNGR